MTPKQNAPETPGPAAGWRPLPPLVVLIGLGLMIALDMVMPEPSPVRSPWTGLGLAVALVGLSTTLVAAAQFRRKRANIQTFGAPTRLVSCGLFKLSRNPMYLGFVLLLAGVAAALGGGAPSVVPVAFFVLAQLWYIPFEERAMRDRFGDDYDRYRRQVRRWL